MTSRYLIYAFNLLSMIILARFFSPETYGSVASILVIYVFFQLMAEAGFGPAIINLNSWVDEKRDGVFSVTVIIGLFLSLLLFFLTNEISDFYNSEEIKKVIPYIAASVFFFSVSILPTAFILRDQLYSELAKANILSEIISTTILIVLYKHFDSVSLLASKYFIMAFTNFIFQYKSCKKTEFGMPKFGTQLRAVKPLLKFSLYQFGFNFINYFSRNLDNILVGKYLGSANLGVYDKAYQLMRYPLMLLTFAMTPAIQPVLRLHADDVDKIETIHSDFVFKLSILGSIIGLIIFILADTIVNIMLGDHWLAVIPLVKILAISIPIQVVLSTSGGFYQAMGKVGYLLLTGIFSAIFIVIAIIYGVVTKELTQLSYSLVIAFIGSFLQNYFIMYYFVFKKSPLMFFIKMIPTFAMVLFMFLFSINKTL
jgi:PST family polysaccharide transporter